MYIIYIYIHLKEYFPDHFMGPFSDFLWIIWIQKDHVPPRLTERLLAVRAPDPDPYRIGVISATFYFF